jgi:hypothetical protein
MISLKDLHDATLASLEVDWASGELRFNFEVSIGATTSVCLVAHEFTFLKCPREFPWGESVSVNWARADKADKELLLVVEMQSGDLIEARVKDVVLE